MPATYVPFTPPSSTPSVTPPVTFTPPGSTPSTTPPALFWPDQQFYASEAALAIPPTVRITPNASEIAFVGIPTAWALYTLTAGAHAADSTHILPGDYDASTNAKHWLKTTVFP